VVESTACPHQKAVSTFLPPAQAPPQLPARREGLLPRREGLMARREDNFPCGIRIIFDSITYYLLHYWEFYLSREDVKPLPQGHSWIDPGDDIDLTAIPLWVRVGFTPLEIPVPL